ncbi:cysteine-rich venom protein-like [Phyllobates terribilis]|uniref:cysteine-rich venom protein-like n=1 Tax=Phyllobates terribilis TaxID=111132 RepID=UPI003CCB6666
MGIFTLYFSTLLMAHVVQIQASDPLARLLTNKPEVKKEIVDLMNKLRAKVVPSASNMLQVEWSEEAAQNAEKWANKCTLKHSKAEDRKISRYGCGENLYMSTNNATWAHAIVTQFDEYRDFEYGKGAKTKTSVVGHYTQIVWATSWEVGCAVARCPGKDFEYYYVCQQCPAGNVNSVAYPYKSGIGCADCPNNCKNDLCTNPCLAENKFTNCNALVKYCKSSDTIAKGCKASCTCENKIF